MLNSSYYDLAMDLTSLAQVIFVLKRSLYPAPSEAANLRFVIFQLGVNAYYLIEMLANILMDGCRREYDTKWLIWPETLCQSLGALGVVKYATLSAESVPAVITTMKIFKELLGNYESYP